MDYSKLLYAAQVFQIAAQRINDLSFALPQNERPAFLEQQDLTQHLKDVHRQMTAVATLLDQPVT